MAKNYNDAQTTTISTLAAQIAELIDDPANAQLPAPELVTYYRLFKDRKFYLDYAVDLGAVELLRTILICNIEDKGIPIEERKPIWIYLMNFGGDLDYCWALINAIDASETPVYTVNLGVCASAAALIFMAGHKRFMFKDSSVLIHEGSMQVSGDSTKVLDASDNYRAMLNHMHDYILSKTSIPSVMLKKKKNNDWELPSSVCLKYSVCDTIIEKLSEII